MTPPAAGATPAQVAAVLTVVRSWERDALARLAAAGALAAPRSTGRSAGQATAERDEHLAAARLLRSCAGDIRHVLDLGTPAALRDPLS